MNWDARRSAPICLLAILAVGLAASLSGAAASAPTNETPYASGTVNATDPVNDTIVVAAEFDESGAESTAYLYSPNGSELGSALLQHMPLSNTSEHQWDPAFFYDSFNATPHGEYRVEYYNESGVNRSWLSPDESLDDADLVYDGQPADDGNDTDDGSVGGGGGGGSGDSDGWGPIMGIPIWLLAIAGTALALLLATLD